MFGKHYRHRSTQSVVAEMAQYNPKESMIFFYDDNFAANPRKTKELLREMIRLRLGFQWSTQVRSDVARDPEMLDLMAEAGCSTVFVGFESVDPRALKEMKKNQTVEDIRTAIREIRARRINVHGMFVFGFDTDTVESARATIDFALAEKIESAQFMILTPLPGSDFYTQMKAEGRIIDTNWETFDAHHVKFIPRGFTPGSCSACRSRRIRASTRPCPSLRASCGDAFRASSWASTRARSTGAGRGKKRATCGCSGSCGRLLSPSEPSRPAQSAAPRTLVYH